MDRPLVIFFIISIFLLMGLTGCKHDSEPNLSIIPNISLQELRQFNITDQLGNADIDSVAITIHYQDGDHDLGVTQEELRWHPWDTLRTAEVKTMIKRGDKYVPHVDYLGREFDNSWSFPPTGLQEGTLNYGMKFYLVSNLPDDTLKFQIRIVDKALHRSQWIETPPVIVHGTYH